MIPPSERAHGSLLSEKEQEKKRGGQTAEPSDGGGRQCPRGGAGRVRHGAPHKLGWWKGTGSSPSEEGVWEQRGDGDWEIGS